ncbi:MAG: Chemotaxis system protein containing CheF-like and HTH domain, archaellum-associated [Candidatus Methanohalarchaeum thermophilum]|uniref:Chemotaxis system protein containing CheF-like and HTH domain, archaellum-associated n=1 Tax=Methanohalarchaeum thermophilum TaxID=1903181 RepID=A0A1Q6DTX4_METT1|nr:MAG: Chemotaxis system protein containing CheF-like and HTH domain, archaellum-associated [Candidatus Methanohalarchaeum thermophilum]
MSSEKQKQIKLDFISKSAKVKNLLNQEPDFKKSRVILSPKKFVIAPKKGKKTLIKKSNIMDVGKKEDLPPALKATIEKKAFLIKYRKKGDFKAIIIQDKKNRINNLFSTICKIVLRNTKVYIKHPAKVSGRIKDKNWTKNNLSVNKKSILLKNSKIDIDSITYVKTKQKNNEKFIAISYKKDKKIITTYFKFDDHRLKIFWKYIRKKYIKIVEEIRKLKLNKKEKKAIVGIYSGAKLSNLPNLLGLSPKKSKKVIKNLIDKKILEKNGKKIQLTNKGRVATEVHLEDVNIG